MQLQLRPWQIKVTKKCLDSFINKGNNKFLINAAPGAGKTLAACAIALELFQKNEIERVITIAPRSEVVSQWAKEFNFATHRIMSKVTGKDSDMSDLFIDVCATWNAIEGLKNSFAQMCDDKKTLVICDELHHAAVEAVWGKSAYDAFTKAKYILMLTGTPERSDGNSSVWLEYNSKGQLEQPSENSYILTYGQAIDYGYCRPVTFHRHSGKFSIALDNKTSLNVSSGNKKVNIPKNIEASASLKKSLSFYKLACTPQFEKDQVTPLVSGYQGSMLKEALKKLEEARNRLPNAGILVITPSIEMAEYVVKLIEIIDDEKPVLVHSEVSNPDEKIKLFRKSDKKWLVSVAMVSEGIDIPRLRVLAYLPHALTELYFRQAVGRIVRSNGSMDDSCGHVILPQLETFNQFAKRIEEEIPPSVFKQKLNNTKKCKICNTENHIKATACNECGTKFPEPKLMQKDCPKCKKANPISAKKCTNCGNSFENQFKITLQEALRIGVIARGAEFSEGETQEAEAIAPELRKKLLKLGDEKILRLINILPDTSLARMKEILEE